MKSIFSSTARSRRSRQSPAPDAKEEMQPFFAKSDGANEVQSKPQPFFQPKLTIGQPNDPYEREADAVADKVVSGNKDGAPAVQSKEISTVQRLATPDEEKMPSTNDGRMEEDRAIQEKAEAGNGAIQKMNAPKEEEKPIQKASLPKEEEKPIQKMESPEEEDKAIQEKTEEEKEALQTKGESGQSASHTNLSSRLSQSRGKGEPLPAPVRTEMEQGIGADFSGVRIHKDNDSVDMNKGLHAQAFTHGQDVYFNAGKFNPEQTDGKRLLAHELTHVVQQGNLINSGVQKQDDSFESVGYGVRNASGQEEKITRPEQVLEEYGMACFGSSVMYMIQSYGLIPPNMSRSEFEHAFTPLNPKHEKKKGPIEVGGKVQKGVMPVDLMTEALQGTNPPKRKTSLGTITATEATMRGANKGGFGPLEITKHMPAILAAFQAQSVKPGYGFMNAFKPESGKAYAPNAAGESWMDSSAELINGKIDADYFKAGNTILTGVNYHYPPAASVGHWVVIVREKKVTLTIAGNEYHLFPADDPLWGSVYVMAPLLKQITRKNLLDTQPDIKIRTFKDSTDEYLTYKNIQVHMLVKNNAFKRTKA
jgi:hypothetical protein